MSDDQYYSAQVVALAFGGAHHVQGVFRECGRGVKISLRAELATYDGSLLTDLVINAHRFAVRISVTGSSVGRVGLKAHPRTHNSEARYYERHPGLSDLARYTSMIHEADLLEE